MDLEASFNDFKETKFRGSTKNVTHPKPKRSKRSKQISKYHSSSQLKTDGTNIKEEAFLKKFLYCESSSKCEDHQIEMSTNGVEILNCATLENTSYAVLSRKLDEETSALCPEVTSKLEPNCSQLPVLNPWTCPLCSGCFSYDIQAAHFTRCIDNFQHKNDQDRECSEDTDTILFVCEICKEDISSLSAHERCIHMNKCIDKQTHSETSQSLSRPNSQSDALSISECPLCFKHFPSLESRSLHIKKCGKARGLNTESVILALQLQEKHTMERMSLGLPLQRAKPTFLRTSEKSSKKVIVEPKNEIESDMQLAKALSLSLKEEEAKKLEAITFSEEITSSPSSSVIRSLVPPKKGQLPGKQLIKRMKKINKPIPLLLLRTDDERMKIFEDKISGITSSKIPIALGDLVPGVSERHMEFEHSENHCIVPNFHQDHVLWSLTGKAEEKNVYYVEQLLEWITPSEIRAGSKLRNLSQIPGHHIYTQHSYDYTFNSPIKGSGHELSQEASTSSCIPSTQEMLDVLIGDRSCQDLELENNVPSQCLPEAPNTTNCCLQNNSVQEGFFLEGIKLDKKYEPNAMIDCLQTLVGNSWMSDVDIFVANGKIIPAHRLLLMLRCPAFKKILAVPIENEKHSLYWKDTSFEGALQFLNFLYTGTAFWKEAKADIYHLAIKYEMLDLQMGLTYSTHYATTGSRIDSDEAIISETESDRNGIEDNLKDCTENYPIIARSHCSNVVITDPLNQVSNSLLVFEKTNNHAFKIAPCTMDTVDMCGDEINTINKETSFETLHCETHLNSGMESLEMSSVTNVVSSEDHISSIQTCVSMCNEPPIGNPQSKVCNFDSSIQPSHIENTNERTHSHFPEIFICDSDDEPSHKYISKDDSKNCSALSVQNSNLSSESTLCLPGESFIINSLQNDAILPLSESTNLISNKANQLLNTLKNSRENYQLTLLDEFSTSNYVSCHKRKDVSIDTDISSPSKTFLIHQGNNKCPKTQVNPECFVHETLEDVKKHSAIKAVETFNFANDPVYINESSDVSMFTKNNCFSSKTRDSNLKQEICIIYRSPPVSPSSEPQIEAISNVLISPTSLKCAFAAESRQFSNERRHSLSPEVFICDSDDEPSNKYFSKDDSKNCSALSVQNNKLSSESTLCLPGESFINNYLLNDTTLPLFESTNLISKKANHLLNTLKNSSENYQEEENSRLTLLEEFSTSNNVSCPKRKDVSIDIDYFSPSKTISIDQGNNKCPKTQVNHGCFVHETLEDVKKHSAIKAVDTFNFANDPVYVSETSNVSMFTKNNNFFSSKNHDSNMEQEICIIHSSPPVSPGSEPRSKAISERCSNEIDFCSPVVSPESTEKLFKSKHQIVQSVCEQPGQSFLKQESQITDDKHYSPMKTPSLQNINGLTKFTISDSPVTPFPDYQKMETPEIKIALKKYGIRALPRKKAISILSHIYDETHPWLENEAEKHHKIEQASNFSTASHYLEMKTTKLSAHKRKRPSKNCNTSMMKLGKKSKITLPKHCLSERTSNHAEKDSCQSSAENSTNSTPDSSKNDSNDMPEESILHFDDECESAENGVEEQIRCNICNYIFSNSTLYAKILMYEPLNLTEFLQELKDNEIKVGASKLMDFLDEQCITFTLPRKEENKKKQQLRTQRFKKRMLCKLSQQVPENSS